MTCTQFDSDRKFLCPVAATLSLIEGKWKPLIIWHLRERKVRFNQLQQELSGISPKMLTKQLRELERDGMVERTVYPEIPPRVEYGLTPLSRSFLTVLEAMSQWGSENLADKMGCGQCSADLIKN
jgi:DNA-binding HxlR family transcriptional regulator